MYYLLFCRSDEEPKFVLLLHKCLERILNQLDCGTEQSICIAMLTGLVTSLQQLGEDRASSGLLGAIGLGKKSTLSLM